MLNGVAKVETRMRAAVTTTSSSSEALARETLPYAGGKVARYYLAETSEDVVELPISEALGRPEHHEYRWVTFEEAGDLLPPRLALVLDWARETLDE